MKRILCTIILAMTAALLHAGYDPGITLRAAPKFSYSEGDAIRTQFEVKTDIELIAFRIGRGSIGLPFSLAYASKSPAYKNIQLNRYASFCLGLSYRYRFTGIFSLRASAYALLRYFDEIKAASGLLGFSLAPMVSPTPAFAISFPIEVEVNANQVDYSAGLAFSFFFSGGGE